MIQYKVLTQADKFFGGKFDPIKLEQLLNEYAKAGWRVIAITSQDMAQGFKSNNRQEIVVVLEYDK
jgi:hypothetical protein